MKFSELKEEYQQDLNQQIDKLVSVIRNTPYVVNVYTRTRHFYARRVAKCWSDDKGHYMPFGGGSYWRVTYCSLAFSRRIDPFGGFFYEIVDGKQFASKGDVIVENKGTKKALLEYCKLCYNIRVKQIRNDLTGAIELGKEKNELLKKYINTGSKVLNLYIGL